MGDINQSHNVVTMVNRAFWRKWK